MVVGGVEALVMITPELARVPRNVKIQLQGEGSSGDSASRGVYNYIESTPLHRSPGFRQISETPDFLPETKLVRGTYYTRVTIPL